MNQNKNYYFLHTYILDDDWKVTFAKIAVMTLRDANKTSQRTKLSLRLNSSHSNNNMAILYTAKLNFKDTFKQNFLTITTLETYHFSLPLRIEFAFLHHTII